LDRSDMAPEFSIRMVQRAGTTPHPAHAATGMLNTEIGFILPGVKSSSTPSSHTYAAIVSVNRKAPVDRQTRLQGQADYFLPPSICIEAYPLGIRDKYPVRGHLTSRMKKSVAFQQWSGVSPLYGGQLRRWRWNSTSRQTQSQVKRDGLTHPSTKPRMHGQATLFNSGEKRHAKRLICVDDPHNTVPLAMT
jgi:hypothetical protein